MGIFNFRSSKRSTASESIDVNVNGLEIKGQAYDTTARALPPIRGSLPVQGNGPNTLEDLKRAARKRSEAQLSTRSHASYATVAVPPNAASLSAPAPAPMVPRLRSKSVGRPSTSSSAPDAPPPPPPKSGARNHKPPHLLLNNKKKSGPPYLLGMTGPDSDNAPDAPPPVPRIASYYYKEGSGAPSPVMSKGPSSVSGSMVSGRSAAAGYVDILDAQGAMRPSDFRSRLKAAGARDYGEDVAERNLGVNGVDLQSPAVIAFYALTGGGPLAYKSDGSAVDVHGNRYAADNIPTHLSTTVEGKSKEELLELANNDIRTPVFPKRTTSLQPQPRGLLLNVGDLAISEAAAKHNEVDDDAKSTATARRRISVHGGPMASATSHAKVRPLSMHPDMSAFGIGESAAIAPDIPRSRPKTSAPDLPVQVRERSRDSKASKKKQKQKHQQARDEDEQQQQQRPRSRSAKSAKSARSIASLAMFQRGGDSESEEARVSSRPRSRSASSKKTRKHEVSSGGEYAPSVPSSRYSSRPTSSASQQPDSRPQSQRSRKAAHLAQILTSPPSSSHTTTRSSTSVPSATASAPTSHPRNRSLGTGTSSRTGGKFQLDDISEHIPGRRSSTRNESVSSTAPTTPSSKHSKHTADTSLDLSYSLPMMQKQAARGHTRGKSSGTTVSSGRGGPTTHRLKAPYYDADEYMSTTTEGSDLDSQGGHRHRSRHQDGEGLLFKDEGYGFAGSGLPGLPGLFDYDEPSTPTWASMQAASSKARKDSSRPPTSVPSNPPPAPPTISKTRHQHPPLPAWIDDVDEDSETDTSSLTVSESEPGGGLKPSSASSAQPTPRIGLKQKALPPPPPQQQSESEDNTKLMDVKLAMRLRKETKRRERTSIHQKTMQAKKFARESYEQGNAADTEL